MNTWILVADSRKAKIFEATKKNSGLTELAGFIHPHAESKLGDNPNGRAIGGHGGTRHGMEPQTLPKQVEVKEFAADLARYLEKEFSVHHFSELILVASPEFLGAVRGALNRNLQGAITHSINKDLTQSSPAELMSYVKDQLFSLH